MRFTQDVSTGINFIRGYANGELRVNENAYRGALILSATTLIDLPNVQNLEDLLTVDVARFLDSSLKWCCWERERGKSFRRPLSALSSREPASASKPWIRARHAAPSTSWWASSGVSRRFYWFDRCVRKIAGR